MLKEKFIGRIYDKAKRFVNMNMGTFFLYYNQRYNLIPKIYCRLLSSYYFRNRKVIKRSYKIFREALIYIKQIKMLVYKFDNESR